MSTNYYLMKNECPCCNRVDRLHIGKFSHGWAFALHVIPEKGLNTLKDWIKFWRHDSYIVDEYGKYIGKNEIKHIIRDNVYKKEATIPNGYTSLEKFLDENNATIDSEGRFRMVKGDLCIGQDKECDLVRGEFG